MYKVNDKLLSWASLIDWQTQEQARKASGMPFIWPHIALMPDAHLGKGATVGSVIPTDKAVMPAAVGVDIGCGMIAWRTDWAWADRDIAGLRAGGKLREIRERIERAIPLSKGNYNDPEADTAATGRRIDELSRMDGAGEARAIAPEWDRQLGSLGSGNHFIEVTRDEENRVWLFLHSGSRGVGNKLANKYIKLALKLNRQWHIRLPDPDLAYLVQGTPEFWDYMRCLRWAQRFAYLNREEMMDRVAACARQALGEFRVTDQVNCHHNYTVQETVFGRQVWLSRKGAIDAHEGVMGLIPGSMATASYVVRGKGCVPALNSSPHGAGRAYSRSKAKEHFTRDDLVKAMDGIEWREDSGTAFLDEIPGAYKDIDQVMLDAEPLVEVVHELRQVINIKGE